LTLTLDYVIKGHQLITGEQIMYSYIGNVQEDKEKFYIDETVDAPVVRWKSNNNIPPEECIDAFLKAGFITEQESINSTEQREIETAQFIREYQERMKDYVPCDEEMYEMRAAFGEGATVVNAITGKVTQL
jgi:hypothetical protein